MDAQAVSGASILKHKRIVVACNGCDTHLQCY
jgi:hypothetical protein